MNYSKIAESVNPERLRATRIGRGYEDSIALSPTGKKEGLVS